MNVRVILCVFLMFLTFFGRNASKVGSCCATNLPSLENADANACAICLFVENAVGGGEKKVGSCSALRAAEFTRFLPT